MATARRRPGSVPLAHVRATKESSRPASYSTLDPLAEPTHFNAGASSPPTSENGMSEDGYPIRASCTPCEIASPVRALPIEPGATEQGRAGEGALQETRADQEPTSQGTQVSDDGRQQWVNGAKWKEGVDVSLTESQVDGDPTLHITSSSKEKAWDALQLEAGHEGDTTSEDDKKDPEKGSVSNVVVWFGPRDPEVSPQSNFSNNSVLTMNRTQ